MYQFSEMTEQDYEEAYALWENTPGMGLSAADSREGIGSYLRRNPGLSFVCRADGRVVGTILCGHDGRRGFIYHLAVDGEHRGQSLARQLVERSLAKLREHVIDKCHLMVLHDNELGKRFWTKSGWQQRDRILLFSCDT